jgi:antitoxin MazE
MKADIIQIGNSKGIRIPKLLLEQCGIEGSVDLIIEKNTLILRPAKKLSKKKKPREGWAEDFARMAKNGDGTTAELAEWQGFQNQFDEQDWKW